MMYLILGGVTDVAIVFRFATVIWTTQLVAQKVAPGCRDWQKQVDKHWQVQNSCRADSWNLRKWIADTFPNDEGLQKTQAIRQEKS